jgi:hypothetical protein
MVSFDFRSQADPGDGRIVMLEGAENMAVVL